jgi:hypothetical protein
MTVMATPTHGLTEDDAPTTASIPTDRILPIKPAVVTATNDFRNPIFFSHCLCADYVHAGLKDSFGCPMACSSELHVTKNEIVAYFIIPSMVLIPVDSEGKPMQEQVIRSILQELDRAKTKKDWSIPYHH